MLKRKQKYLFPILALVVAEILWGINTPVIKLGLQTVPLPIYLSVGLMGAALLILPFAIKNWKHLSRKEYAILIIGSIINITLGNVVLLMGLEMIPSVNASLIGLLNPLLLFILSVQFLKEHMSLKTFLGIIIAFLGAAIIIGQPWSEQGNVIGNLLIVLSVLCSVVGTLICKSVLKKGSSHQVTFIHLFVGTLPIVIFALQYIPEVSMDSIGATGIVAIAYNIPAVALANIFYMYGLKHKKAQDVGIFSYIHPVVTAIAAWFILAEVPGQSILIGAPLIFLGIYLSELRRPRHTTVVSKK